MELDKLKAEFPNADIEWRVQRSGIKDGPWAIVVPYITNRAIMDRLDTVCGVAHWGNKFCDAPGGEGGVLCGIEVEVEPGKWVTKWDGAERTAIESVKGGLSAAMKRAAVQWGIGRYLYALDGPFYAKFDRAGKNSDKIEGTYYRWNPPQLTEKAADHPDRGSKESAAPSAADRMYDELTDLLADKRKEGALDDAAYAKALEWLDEHARTVTGMTAAKRKLAERFAPAQPLPPKTAGQKFAEQAQAAVVGDDAGADEAFGSPTQNEIFR